ncbi:MAG: hypothetical protein GXO74_16865 [Calditrichaeota bacterium]|nr:hypothetical protein [Calditrichota bacterium]
MDELIKLLEILSYLITILGVPAAIFVYLKEQRLQREEREYGTFDALDNKYIELQELCLNYPDLDIFDTPLKKQKTLTEKERKQEEAILLIRISIFERAFLMYQRVTSKVKKDQWEGWDIEIREWLDRKNFKDIWSIHKKYFDKKFVEHYDRG